MVSSAEIVGTIKFEYECKTEYKYNFEISNQLFPQNSHLYLLLTGRQM